MSQACFNIDKINSTTLVVVFDGFWKVGASLPTVKSLAQQIISDSLSTVVVVPGKEFEWDSRFVAYLYSLYATCQEVQCSLDVSGLPCEIDKLLALSTAIPTNKTSPEFQLGRWHYIANVVHRCTDILGFIGEVALAFVRLVSFRSTARFADFFLFFQQVGVSALGVVSLISVLTGMILAYLGTVQLRQFGAEVYVSNLVAVGMAREMGALMTAVIIAGRSGAAYAAQLGTMQVNDEIDALTTLGMKPIDFLVLPRIIALVIALPLLCVYSNFLGMIGGGFVATGMNITFRMYFYQLLSALSVVDVMTGIFKSVVFGLLIAIAGCRAGMRCGRSSAAVGQATTEAVVTAIIYLVVADACLNIIFYKLGI